MLLSVDVGNSQTVIGVFDGETLAHHWRISTEGGRTADEHALIFDGLLAFADLSFSRNVHGVVVSSVVPQVTAALRLMTEEYFHFPPVVVEPGVKTGMALRYENPREIGPDRIVNAVAAGRLYGSPAIVVDFGTSTNFDVVGAGGDFIGGVIAPGVVTSLNALVSRAARLPKVEIARPETVVGRTTVGAMQSGIVFGFAGQVDALVRHIRTEIGENALTIATGGLASAILEICETVDEYDEWLTLKGLRLIWEMNTT
jgi:type III pantothenate kinase